MSDRIVIDITDMDINGRGIGRSGAKAVFVKGAVVGDCVECSIIRSEKRYDVALPLNYVSLSPDRVVPPCDGYDICAGCVFLHCDRGLETQVKRRSAEAAFRRAGLSDIKVPTVISGSADRYRNKAVLHGAFGRFGYLTENGKDLFCGSCIKLPDIFNRIKDTLEELIVSENTSTPESIMLRLGGKSVMVCAQAKYFGEYKELLRQLSGKVPDITSVWESVGYPTSMNARYRHLFGEKYIYSSLCGVDLRISAPSFFQVNEEVASALIGHICDMIPAEGPVLDLYCGIGSITLPAAKMRPELSFIGVEINPDAVEDARANAAAAGIHNAEFICADATSEKFTDIHPHTVIVDPPRFGLTPRMIKTILELSPKVLIYMSCNPSSLAGNILKLTEGGYRVSSVIAADMFPGAGHVEAVACLVPDDR